MPNITLSEFLATTGTLRPEDMERIIDQALVLIEEVYVHLPLKKAIHAIDPVQRLKLLRRRLSAVDERSFHDQMIRIFVSLRDLHTNYILPEPYNLATAWLPVLIEEFFEGEERHYIASKLLPRADHPDFVQGVTVTHWNGVPIARAIANIADREAGSNEAARHVQGLDRLTQRPMMMSLPPDEEWVILGYLDGEGNAREIRLEWQVFLPDEDPAVAGDGAATGEAAQTEKGQRVLPVQCAMGLDLLGRETAEAKRRLFAKPATRGKAAGADIASFIPEVFKARTISRAGKHYGHIRIFTFSANPNGFGAELIRLVEAMPSDGLIIDVRGNGGGIIMNGERALQLFTDRKIEAERLSFINTPLTRTITEQVWWAEPWGPSIETSLLYTGAVYSQGFPIEEPELTNAVGQRYTGPCILITDARCYSTTDIFAAGWQDHAIGPILGVDGNTGAGGANVLEHEFLMDLLGPQGPFRPLPGGASMRVSFRRTTRVGPNAGVPVEDLGVVPNRRHYLTINDLLNSNEDLMNQAIDILEGN